MINYTADQIALRTHLEAEAAKTAAWVAEADGRWAASYTTDLDHWAEMDVTSIEDLHRHDAIATYSDTHKEMYGFRDRYTNVEDLSTAEIEAMNDAMFKRAEEDRLREESYKLKEIEDEKTAAAELGVSLETYLRWQKDAGNSTSRTPEERW